jgi:hypothetical protein
VRRGPCNCQLSKCIELSEGIMLLRCQRRHERNERKWNRLGSSFAHHYAGWRCSSRQEPSEAGGFRKQYAPHLFGSSRPRGSARNPASPRFTDEKVPRTRRGRGTSREFDDRTLGLNPKGGHRGSPVRETQAGFAVVSALLSEQGVRYYPLYIGIFEPFPFPEHVQVFP